MHNWNIRRWKWTADPPLTFSWEVIYITKLIYTFKSFTFLFWFLTIISIALYVVCPYEDLASITNTDFIQENTLLRKVLVQLGHLCSSYCKWKDSSLAPQWCKKLWILYLDSETQQEEASVTWMLMIQRKEKPELCESCRYWRLWTHPL